MTSEDSIVAEARQWLGTPYAHQASCKGAGTDCLGLLRGIWRATIGAEPALVPSYTADWSEAAGDEVLWHAAKLWLVQKSNDNEGLGDVLLFRMQPRSVAKHLGVQSLIGENRQFIHAYSGHSVVESALSDPWRRKIVARFRFPKGV
jgi:NlpC/P60 family putative phage cell wall peptidase